MLSQPNGLDLLHICYGGLAGQVDVVGGLNRVFSERGLTTGVLAVVPQGEVLPPEYARWTQSLQSVRLSGRGRIDDSVAISRIARTAKPRALIFHTYLGSMAAWVGARIGGNLRAVLMRETLSTKLRGPFVDLMSLKQLAVSRAVVVPTEDYKRAYRLQKVADGLRRSVFVVPNGVDPTQFDLVPHQETTRKAGNITLGMAGRLATGKRFEHVIEAVYLLTTLRPDVEIQLMIAGTGQRQEELARYVAGLALVRRVRFLGDIELANMGSFYQGLDIYVHASDGEAISRAVLQASSCGVPVIASDVPGIREMVTAGLPIRLVAPGDSHAIAKAVAALVDLGPEDRRLLGRALALGVRKDFTVHKQAEGILGALASMDPTGPWDRL